jgi:hypothetical protein
MTEIKNQRMERMVGEREREGKTGREIENKTKREGETE